MDNFLTFSGQRVPINRHGLYHRQMKHSTLENGPTQRPLFALSAVSRATVSTVYTSPKYKGRLVTVRAAVVSNVLILTFINIYATINKCERKQLLHYKEIKISCKNKKISMSSIRTATIQLQTLYYIKLSKVVGKCIKEAKKQHNTGLIARSNNKIKTKLNIMKKQTGKVDFFLEQGPTLLVNG
jgi:hypothetical protein